MKLLLDQNLSFRLCEVLSDAYPEMQHVSQVGLKRASDLEIWQYASQNGYAIVTQDADFFDPTLLHGFPPQVIWLRCGNQKTEMIEAILRHHENDINEFIEGRSLACLEIY